MTTWGGPRPNSGGVLGRRRRADVEEAYRDTPVGQLRASLDVSRAALAEICGVNKTTVFRWEHDPAGHAPGGLQRVVLAALRTVRDASGESVARGIVELAHDDLAGALRRLFDAESGRDGVAA